MAWILLFFAAICSGSVFGVFVFQRKFTELLPVSCAGIIVVLFCAGLAGSLQTGIYIVILLAVGLYGYSILFVIRKRRILSSLKMLLSADGILFLTAAGLFAFADFKMEMIVFDDFTHWMDVVKAMTIVKDFGTNPLADILWPSYPPGISLFEYFTVQCGDVTRSGGFAEWKVLYGLHILTASMIMPLFRKIHYRNPLRLAGCLFSILIIPAIFFFWFYYSVLIDSFLGIMCGIGFVYILIYRKEPVLRTLSVSGK